MSGAPGGFIKAGLETRDGEWVSAGRKLNGQPFDINEINRWNTLGKILIRREKHPSGQVVFIKWKGR